MKKTINSYNLLSGDLEKKFLPNNVAELSHHYDCDMCFVDKVRENAKKLGYIYERNLNTLDYEPSLIKVPVIYGKLSMFTKIDTEKSQEFPKEKIAIYRGYSYEGEEWCGDAGAGVFLTIKDVGDNLIAKNVYDEYVRLFCGEEGFEYSCTYAINPINTILIVIVDTVNCLDILTKYHKNFVLFCLISTSSPHQIFIGPDLRMNKDSDYQNKIEELKFLLGIDEVNDNL